MAGRPVGLAPFGNGGVMVVCDDGTAWYMAAPYGVWFRQMPVPGVPASTSAPKAASTATGTAAAAPAAEEEPGGWTKKPPFPVPDDIPPDRLPPGVQKE